MNKFIDGNILPLTEGQQAPPVIALQAHTCARCARSRHVGMGALSANARVPQQIIKNGIVVDTVEVLDGFSYRLNSKYLWPTGLYSRYLPICYLYSSSTPSFASLATSSPPACNATARFAHKSSLRKQ